MDGWITQTKQSKAFHGVRLLWLNCEFARPHHDHSDFGIDRTCVNWKSASGIGIPIFHLSTDMQWKWEWTGVVCNGNGKGYWYTRMGGSAGVKSLLNSPADLCKLTGLWCFHVDNWPSFRLVANQVPVHYNAIISAGNINLLFFFYFFSSVFNCFCFHLHSWAHCRSSPVAQVIISWKRYSENKILKLRLHT